MKPLLRLKPYLLRYKRTLLWGVLTVIASNLFTVVQPMFLGLAIDELKVGMDTHSAVAGDLLRWAVIIVGFSVIAGVFTFLTRQTIIVVSRHIEFDLRNDLLSHLQSLSYSYFQNTPTGDLMAHATNDIGAVRNVLGPGIMYPTDTLLTFTMVLVLMLVKDWQLTLLALIPLPFASLMVYQLGKQVHKKSLDRQAQFSLLTTRAQENLSGIRVIKSYVREEHEIGLFSKLSWDYLKKNLVLARIQSLMWPLMFVIIGCSIVITLYAGGLKVISGELSIGSLSAFLAYLVMLIWPVIAFGWVINLLQQGAASMERLSKILDTSPEIKDTECTVRSIRDIEGRIEFRGVKFTHNGTAKPTLQNIDLTIERGMTVAIVGYTGSGKTSLINLIPRLYDISEGQLLIDGHDIKTIPLGVLRTHIGYVPQETFLFSDTLTENIRYGTDDGTPDHVQEAAEISQIAKDVLELPKQFDTMIGERGITLSGGQKQRTSIARALIRQPKILILDDCLSAVDTYTEEEILRRLRTFMKGRTSIIISHRISTVKEADLIVVVDQGEIVERGTHNELVARGGIYADLNEKQLLERELEEL
ncbi:MAG: ABC-type multidrug transport system component [Bacteroidetes bacterium]|nr:ABC-type multidrug transport system component [Bacteroidota bacterium]